MSDPMRDIRRIYIHCSAAPARYGLEDIRQWHLDHGWSDVGYHLVVELAEEGWRAVAGRGMGTVGSHVRGDNSHSYGICICGRYDDESPPEDAWVLAVNSAAGICYLHNLDPLVAVLGHRECGTVPGVPATSKTCPGAAVPMDAFRDAVAAQVDELRRLQGLVGA